MGDRASIQFEKDGEKSVVLFSHNGGMWFVGEAKRYFKNLKATKTGSGSPLDRFVPNTVMVDFIQWLTKDEERIESDLYLGADESEGDNSDNGHHIIKM